jgi:hypothetical protein
MGAGADELDRTFGGGESDDTEETTERSFGATDFLTDTESKDGIDFPLASGVQWVRLGEGLVAGTATAVVLGIQSFATNVFDALASVVDGVGDFGAGLVTVIGNDATEAVAAAFGVSIPSVGVFTSLAGIAVVLATFYVLAQGPQLLEVLR